MYDGKFVLPDMEKIEISGSAADKLIRSCSGCAAMLYIYILRRKGDFSTAKALNELRMSEVELEKALRELDLAGLVKGNFLKTEPLKKPADEAPQYTSRDISREMTNGTAFRMLAKEVESSLGKLLTSDDLMKLFGIYDNLGLPAEVILILVTYCTEEVQKKYGDGRKPTLRYIEKAAYDWEHRGIVTLELAEDHIKRSAVAAEKAEEIKRVMQLGGQPVTNKMLEYIRSWIEMGFEPDAVEIAYERTVENTGKLAWKYMDSILRRWDEKKLHTADDIEMKDCVHVKNIPQQELSECGGPTAKDIERMKKILEELG